MSIDAKKTGLDLILDAVEAARVRIDSRFESHANTWDITELLKTALAEITRLRTTQPKHLGETKEITEWIRVQAQTFRDKSQLLYNKTQTEGYESLSLEAKAEDYEELAKQLDAGAWRSS